MYVIIFRKIINLKWHLKGVHQLDDVRASSARINLGYRKNHELLSQVKEKPNHENMKGDSAPSQIV